MESIVAFLQLKNAFFAYKLVAFASGFEIGPICLSLCPEFIMNCMPE